MYNTLHSNNVQKLSYAFRRNFNSIVNNVWQYWHFVTKHSKNILFTDVQQQNTLYKFLLLIIKIINVNVGDINVYAYVHIN